MRGLIGLLLLISFSTFGQDVFKGQTLKSEVGYGTDTIFRHHVRMPAGSGATGYMVTQGTDTGFLKIETDTFRLSANIPIKINGDDNCCLPYDVWAGVLTQAGTSAPTATVLQNTTDTAMIITYLGVGQYAITNTGAFTVSKSYSPEHQTQAADDNTNTKYILYVKRNSADTFLIETRNHSTGNLENDLLKEKFIEIRVYP